jgi:formylmethanofuran dehydrogenase subunit E
MGIRRRVENVGIRPLVPEDADEIKDCERCGFTYNRKELVKEKETGREVCPECLDTYPPERKPHG